MRAVGAAWQSWRHDRSTTDGALAVAQAYNNWVHDWCGVQPDRLYPAALVPVQNAHHAALELERVANALGSMHLSGITGSLDDLLAALDPEPLAADVIAGYAQRNGLAHELS